MSDLYLYRAKRVDNGEWAEGLPSYDINGKITEFEVYKGFANCETFEIDPLTIRQFTGLLDKDSKSIFEGDIIKSDDSIGIIKFGKYGNGFHTGYYVDWINYPYLRPELAFWNERSIVIGNIFDNAELLEAQNG